MNQAVLRGQNKPRAARVLCIGPHLAKPVGGIEGLRFRGHRSFGLHAGDQNQSTLVTVFRQSTSPRYPVLVGCQLPSTKAILTIRNCNNQHSAISEGEYSGVLQYAATSVPWAGRQLSACSRTPLHGTNRYPRRPCSVDREEYPYPRIASAERALFRILGLCRSHTPGVTGGFRAAIDILRRTRGPAGAVKNQLPREGY